MLIKFLDGTEREFETLVGANLTWANLTCANLTRANLTRADLMRANLTGADLMLADLMRANLMGAKGVVLGPQRSDGYNSWLTHDGADYIVRMGCRSFTFAQAREHWLRTRGGTRLGDESLAIVDYLEARAPSMILA